MARLMFFPLMLKLVAVAFGQQISTCLSAIPNITVLTPASSGFADAITPYNLRLSPSPSIIVTPASVSGVQAIVACAANASLSVSARSGGHSYAAYGLAGDIVVDLSALKSLSVDAAGNAVVQTGNRLGDIATGIFDQGGRALPHGSCPYVGAGGHTLYGGFGYFSRVGGLLVDRVVSAEVVLANGTLVTASDTSNTDLFWAIRGGGPSFGIVTAWTYSTFPAPPITINYRINFNALSNSRVVSAYIAWQTFLRTAPNELAAAAVLGSGVFLQLQGDYYGTQENFQTVIQPLMNALPRTAQPVLTSRALGWIEGLVADDGSLSTVQPDIHDTFFAKSLVTTSPSSNASIRSWINYLSGPGSSTDTNWFAQVDLYGGAISNMPTTSTAFAQRNGFLVYQFYASSSNSNPPYPSDGINFVNGMLDALEPNPTGAYPNYMDPTLVEGVWEVLYFGQNVPRLRSVKASVDPNNTFKFSEGF